MGKPRKDSRSKNHQGRSEIMKCKTCESEQEFGAYCLNCGTPFDTPDAKLLQEKYKPSQRQRMKVRWRGWNIKNKLREFFADWYLTLRALNFIGQNLLIKILILIIKGITVPIWIWWYIGKEINKKLARIMRNNIFENIPRRWERYRDGFYSTITAIMLLILFIALFLGELDSTLFRIPLYYYIGLIPGAYIFQIIVELVIFSIINQIRKVKNQINKVKVQIATQDTEKKGKMGKN